ncbi:MAG: cytochrome c oxidase accessory protein CcoG [Pseudomonadota bacterium]
MPDGEVGLSTDKRAASSQSTAGGASATASTAETPELYRAREQIQPKLAHGKYRAIKWALLVFTLGVYYGLPWVRWPRAAGEPDQAVLVDFAGGRFYFFFIEIWPDELYYVTGLLILSALALFLATALFGRVWCGYTCPQTVWTDLYIAVERLIEGDRNKRLKLNKGPWSAEKVAKKVSKHTIWLLIAAATGGAWIFYFHDAPTVFGQFFRGEAPGSAYMFAGILTFTTYTLAGMMREQVCTYMCPWPRIQAALTDEETLQVTYKADRGEPRGSHKKGDTWEGRGDCVDCHACVVVCPMGIDIRDGAQLECINCALCIDACDDVMKKVGRPKSLIGYDTDKNAERRVAGEKPTVKLLRARTIFYGAAFAIVTAVMLLTLGGRATLEVNVLRDRAPSFVTLSDGSVRNAYTVKIVNKDNDVRTFDISLAGVGEDFELEAVGLASDGRSVKADVFGDDVRSIRVFVTAPANEAAPVSTPLAFSVKDVGSDEASRNDTSFLRGRAK